MGELDKKDIDLFITLEYIDKLNKEDFENFEIPSDLFKKACIGCPNKNNGFCTGYCIQKFISRFP